MKAYLATVLLITACASQAQSGRAAHEVALAARAPAATLHASSTPPRPGLVGAVHDVLAAHCGKCHEGKRASAVPDALAAFDLDQPDWPSRFDSPRRFRVALERLSSSPAADQALFLDLRHRGGP